jgi:hypothetical protein
VRRPRWSTVLEAIHAKNSDERAWISDVLDAASPLFQTANPELGFIAVDHAADAKRARIRNVVEPHEAFVPGATATMRNRSVRTIANQVASLLRKTGKTSRRELIARS